jgi:5-methylcytosine-specific restriction endonuclease McrA
VRRLGRDYAYRKVADRILSMATVCAICGRPLDFNAPARSRWSPSVDHVLPVSRTAGLPELTRERLATDPENLRATHYGCNARRGNRRRRRVHTSRAWR